MVKNALKKRDDRLIRMIRRELGHAGVDVDSVCVVDESIQGGARRLMADFTAATLGELLRGIGKTLGLYHAALKHGLDTDELAGVVKNPQGIDIVSYSCEKKWSEAYLKGDLSYEELLEEYVLDAASLKV